MADFTTFAIHADLHTSFLGQLQHIGSNHKCANCHEYYGAVIVQALGRQSRFQPEHKEEIDTQIYIFEFREEICHKCLALLIDISTVV
jgi:hypothetical protein